MRKRLQIVFTFVVLILFSFGCSNSEQAKVQSKPPNILFAIADDWSWPHAGAYGDPVVQTPTFDRLAEEGVLFEHAYVSSPSCTPSRAAILTGQWHWRLEESANLWSTLKASIPVYPDILEDNGYFVGFSRKGWGPGDYEVGGRSRNPAGTNFDDFDAFFSQRTDGKPFVFWFGSLDPHRPYDTGSGKASGIELGKIRLPAPFPDHEDVRSDVADYYFEVQRFDRELGEILDKIKAAGELENTLVVVTGDNGMPFPRCKSNLYDGGTRVPLVIHWPAKFPGGRKITDFVSLTDLAPTFLDLANAPVPAEMTGKSLVSILASNQEGRVDAGRDFVLTGKERHVPGQEAPDQGGYPMRAIRTQDFLYIYNFRPDRWPAGTPNYDRAYFPGSWYGDCDNGPTKTYMVENKDLDDHHRRLFELSFAKRPAEELYDLSNDPNQLSNVAENPEYDDVKARLNQQLMDALEKSKDPRLGNADWLEEFPYYGGSPLAPGYRPKEE
jgi:arylsulfatase A-like enzyme